MFDMEIMFKCKGERLAEVYEIMKRTGMNYGDILLYGAEQLRKESEKKAEGASCSVRLNHSTMTDEVIKN